MTQLLRTLILAIGLLCHGQGGATGLLAELDASSPAATLGSFHAETRRVEAPYETYNAAPTTATQFAMSDALQRIGAQLFDLSEIPPATRQKAGNAVVGYLADRPAAAAGDPAGIGPWWRRWARRRSATALDDPGHRNPHGPAG